MLQVVCEHLQQAVCLTWQNHYNIRDLKEGQGFVSTPCKPQISRSHNFNNIYFILTK